MVQQGPEADPNSGLWSANGDSPVVDPAIPDLAISGDDGNLVILDQTTNSVIWSTRANPTTNDTVAVLRDDGNLVLRSSSNSSDVFWQSFDYPTDTFFAGAKIGWNKATGLNRRLVSRKNLVDRVPNSTHWASTATASGGSCGTPPWRSCPRGSGTGSTSAWRRR
jgi:hypothetical protein